MRFCHLHHVRVHVTVNTLIKDGELDEVLQVLRLIEDAGADAVLVQDLGVLSLARQCLPGLPVHASTQMALHNASGVRFARHMGMSRVVLARECSLREIGKCCAVGPEIEVFGHGAQCVGVSGECLYSSMQGERSGNRGRCAQPCRLQYTLRGEKGAWLSPRDVCLRNDLDRLAALGVASVKLEGRLKRPEYVAVVAGSYRRGIDTLRPADEAETEGLRQIFQRGGFMRGYAMGCEDAGVICPERVNHGGVALGRLLSVSGRLAKCAADKPLHDGDGLQLRGAKGEWELIYAGPEVPAGGTAVLRLREDIAASAGDEVWRLADNAQLEAARALPMPQIPVSMRLRAMPGEPLALTAGDGGVSVTVTGDTVQPARSRALTPEDAARSLGKTGDTAFVCEGCEAETENAFVAVSALNSLRREALERLAEARIAAFGRQPSPYIPPEEVRLPQATPRPLVIWRTEAQRELALRLQPDARLAWEPEDLREDALREGLSRLPEGDWLQLPVVCEEDTLQMLLRLVTELRERLGGVVLGSVGQLGAAWPVPMGAGSGIPVMNRRAAALLLREGCSFVTASCELTGRELRTLMAGAPPILVPAYGRTQLMLLHHCPARTLLGLSRGHAACAMCDTGDARSLRGLALTDRKGCGFPLLRVRLPEGCVVRLLNTLPTDVREQVAREGWSPLLTLTDETALPQGPSTQGHWTRAVE